MLTIRGRRPRVLMVVSVDWFFVSHRLVLAEALRARGCDVEVAMQVTDSRAPIEAAGFPLHAMPFERGSRDPRSEAKAVAAVVDLYRRVRPDVAHHVSIKPIFYGTFAATLTRVPIIINAVSGLGYSFIARSSEGFKERAIRTGLKAAYRVALAHPRSNAIFQNDEDRGLLEPSLAAARTRMIRGSGVNLERFAVSPLPGGAPVVLLPARLLRDKGIVEFVEAARILRAQGSSARFVIAGRLDKDNPAGIDEGTLDGWTRDGLVEWMGHIAPSRMRDVYSAASLVVLPSYREGLSLSLVEANASGRACVTTDVPGCRDVIREGQNGWLVPPRDALSLARAIGAAIEDRSELARRGMRGREIVEQEFSLDAVIAATLRIYEEMLGGASSASA